MSILNQRNTIPFANCKECINQPERNPQGRFCKKGRYMKVVRYCLFFVDRNFIFHATPQHKI